ncbi:MAG: DUF4238 domain-containing protein [Alphaproteobacteria bacterium]|nr:DUF4238 domain-containing protein [Alphaproteobacteria bacterium]
MMKKKHHTVPRFYLKHFAADKAGRSINVLNINKQIYFKTASLKDQCYHNYFYGKDESLENVLSIFEGRASTLIAGLLHAGAAELTGGSIRDLFHYVLIQLMRTVHAKLLHDEVLAILQTVLRPSRDI